MSSLISARRRVKTDQLIEADPFSRFAEQRDYDHGYSEFEYAQKALRFGAFDYLLKQVNKDKLTDALERLKATLEEKQKVQKDWNCCWMIFEIFSSMRI